MATPIQPIIIIKKKKGGHGGHHGGAWKVAYADFVTAMMALFIVLWLLNTSQDVKQAVAGYFRDPSGSNKQVGSSVGGVGENLTMSKKNMSQLKDKLQEALKQNPKFEKLKDQVKMTVTGEGLRIELLETEKGMFFDTGDANPTGTGKALLEQLAGQLGQIKNTVLLEGHTDAQNYTNATYTNWELSSDRANAARRIMQSNGLRANQVGQVRGFADQQLRLPNHPEDPSNRRISIIVKYLEGTPPTEEKAGAAEGSKEKAEGAAGKEKDSKTPEAKAPEQKAAPAAKPAQ